LTAAPPVLTVDALKVKKIIKHGFSRHLKMPLLRVNVV
jgi:hypothetical protein